MTASAASALDNVMAQAEEAAASIAPVPVPLPTTSALPVPANVNRPSMESFIESGGMDVDEFLKVNAEGFRIGDKMVGLLEELVVEIDMTEVTPIVQSRHEAGGKTTFLKSYDGATTPDGKNFNAEFDRLTRLNVKNDGPFQTAEIPMTLIADVEDPKKGSSLVVHEGTRIGFTPSKTGAREFQKFAKKLRNNNPALLEDTIKVKVTHQRKDNGTNTWGTLGFELAD